MNEHEAKLILDSLNVDFPDKCACCPYMFEFKCRAEQCPYEETEN